MYDLLKGTRVIELGHILNAPLAGQVLGDFGADLIKVEALTGDVYRYAGAGRNPTMGAAWQAVNRNKRSIAINLKTDQGKVILRKLLGGAHAMIHNLRVKAIERLGFDYLSVDAIRPGIVYCFSPGFGQSGPYGGKPAIDDLIQAHAGIASLNQGDDGTPRLVPMVVADTMSAQMLGQSVLAGLLMQQKTGQGCCIEVPMFETVTSLMLSQHLQGRAFEPPIADFGYQRVLSEHRRPCKTRDGYIVHGVYRREHWRTLFTALQMDDWLNSPVLADRASVAANISTLYALMAREILPTRTTAQWLELFTQLDLACAPVKGFEDIYADEHLKAVGLFREYDHPTEGRMREVRFPVTVTGVPSSDDRPPPTLGWDTAGVLNEIGYSDCQVAQLRDDGVVGLGPEALNGDPGDSHNP